MGYDQVLHHRTASRKEIDFVGPQFGGIAFESKCVDGGWRRDALTLKASRWQGIVATRSEIDFPIPRSLRYRPRCLPGYWTLSDSGLASRPHREHTHRVGAIGHADQLVVLAADHQRWNQRGTLG